MATVTNTQPEGRFYSVLADGKFHLKVEETTPGAKRREYETSDGKKGVKYELEAQEISGIIDNISIYDGEYGKNILIEFTKDEGDGTEEEPVIISLSAQSNFGEDFLKKLPNIDIKEIVSFKPFAFENEQGKKVKGINIFQKEKKLFSFYHVEDPKTKRYEPTNGFPEIPAESKKWDSEDWKLYFGQARKFLLVELEKHPIFKVYAPKEADEDF